MKNNFLIFDIETCGKSANKNSIIQLAALKVNGRLEILDSFNEFCRPHSFKYWDQESEGIHGISRSMCESFQSGMAMIKNFLKFVRQYQMLGVCHAAFRHNKNKLFDYHFLRNHCLLYNVFHEVIYGSIPACVSTILSANDFSMVHNAPEKQNLASWAKYLGIEFKHHDALEDCKAQLEVFKHLVSQGISFQGDNNGYGYQDVY